MCITNTWFTNTKDEDTRTKPESKGFEGPFEVDYILPKCRYSNSVKNAKVHTGAMWTNRMKGSAVKMQRAQFSPDLDF